VCPHVGDGDDGSSAAWNTVPGPRQVTAAPSPVDHTTEVGVAVAVTVTAGVVTVAGTPAFAVAAPQPVTASHVGRFTNCCPVGDNTIVGAVKVNLL
jgi:hypothetical protein